MSHESHDLRWITKDYASLPEHDEALARMFNKWVSLDPAVSACFMSESVRQDEL